MNVQNKIFSLLALCMGYLFSPTASALEVDVNVFSPASSSWVENEYVKTRLISSHENVASDPTFQHFLGWEVVLKGKGWKTYWRSPGDAGIPPTFNWENSQNLGKAEVHFPLPERFQIFNIQTFGYGERVIIPIRIQPQIGGVAMNVKLNVHFMACKEICIPFNENYDLTLPAETGSSGGAHVESVFASDINYFYQKNPESIQANNGHLEVSDVLLSGISGKQKLTITLMGKKHLAGGDIYIEAEKHFKFGTPQRQLLADGKGLIISFPVHSMLKDADLKGKELRITISDGWGYSIEQFVKVP